MNNKEVKGAGIFLKFLISIANFYSVIFRYFCKLNFYNVFSHFNLTDLIVRLKNKRRKYRNEERNSLEKSRKFFVLLSWKNIFAVFFIFILLGSGLALEDYNPNSFLKSPVDQTLTSDCCFNLGSFDQISALSFKARAKNGESLGSGETSLPLSSNSLYFSDGKISIDSFNFPIIDSIWPNSDLEYLIMSGMLSFISSNTYAGEDNFRLSNLEFIIINLTGFSLKKENKMFVSTTSCIYQPSALCLFQTRSFNFSPNLKQSSSVSLEFSSILSSFLSKAILLTFSDKNALVISDQFSSLRESISFFNSFGIDSVMFGILIPPINSVYNVDTVEVFKSFGFFMFFVGFSSRKWRNKLRDWATKIGQKGLEFYKKIGSRILDGFKGVRNFGFGLERGLFAFFLVFSGFLGLGNWERKKEKRKIRKKDKFKLEAEHVFVFLLVAFFLGFMFLDYSLGLQETFQTNSTDWTGTFWQTQTDGENITLNGSIAVELPDNQGTLTTDKNYVLNMTGNVLLWHLNNDSSLGENDTWVYDSSGNGKNSILIDSGAVPTSLGVLNKSFVSNTLSNSRLKYDPNILSGATAYTHAVWVKAYDITQESYIVNIRGPNYITIDLINLSTSTYSIEYGQADLTYMGFTINEWHHIAATWNGTDHRLYYDGVKVNETNGSNANSGANSASLNCWSEDSWANNCLNGTLDEYAIFNRALGENEVSDIYNAQRGYNSEGNYTSNVLDATAQARWENISWSETNQTALDNISMEYRTSNDNSNWLAWTSVLGNGYGQLNDSARYLQYRSYLTTNDTSITPYLMDVNVTYFGNTAPYKPELHLPENNSLFGLVNNNISFNWMNSSDIDEDKLRYWFYLNDIVNQSLQESENISLVLSFGSYNWSVVADDNQANTSSDVWLFTINAPPTTPNVDINSSDGYNLTNVSLFALFTLIDDADANDLVYNISWLKNNITQFSFENVSNTSMFVSEELTEGNTTKGETWTASLVVCDIPYNDCGNWVNSTELTILNAIPPVPDLNLPNNNTFINNQTIFSASNSTDIDNDNINYYWEVDNNADFSSNEYTNTSISETANATELGKIAIADGTYWWRVLAYDNQENSSWSEVRNFTMDNTYPGIILDNPVNGSSINNNPVVDGSVTQINLTITDTNLDSVWWSNDSGEGNYTDIVGSYDINITDYSGDTLNITIWANDTADNIQEIMYSFTIDLLAPVFVWISPEANEVVHGTQTINLTATDALSSVDTLTVWYNGSAVNYSMTNDAGTNEYYYFWDTTQGSDGQYTITVYGNDTANNLKEESRYATVDNTAPTIALESPTNNSHTNSTNITFTFTPDDAHDIDNCTLIVENGINSTSASITKASSNSITGIYLTHGTYDWNINCTDQENNYRGNETDFVIDVNLVALIDFTAPTSENNSYLNYNSTYLNFTVNEEDEDTFTIVWNESEYFFYNQTHEYNFSDLDDGIYNYYGWVNDSRNQTNYTETRTVVIDTVLPEEFNLTTPENNSQSDDSSPVLLWGQPTEENFANYTIEFSNQSDFGSINSSYYTILSEFSNYTTPLENATWYWRVTAYDLANNYRTSDAYAFTVAGRETVTETITTTITTTTSGGSTKKLYALNIISPPTVTLYSNDEITIPLVIRNNAKDMQLQNINLAVQSDSGELIGFLDITNIAKLLPGKDAIVNLRLITGALKLLRGEGNFGLTITANVANPAFQDSIKIFANVIDVNSENRTTTYDEINAAHRLFDGNPECMDLVELLTQADEALNNNQFDKALSLAKGAISACKDLVGISSEDKVGRLKLPFGIYLPFDIKNPFSSLDNIPKNIQILALEVVGMAIVLVGILKYLRSRRNKGKRGSSPIMLLLLFLLAMPIGNHKKRSFDEIRMKLLKTLANNKKQTLNELAVNSGLCWRTAKTHIVYLKGKGFAKEVLSTPYVRIFEVTEKGEEESKST